MSETQRISMIINGSECTAEVEPRTLLVHFLRDVANLTGTHIGCDTTSCGACTVVVNGKAVKSCTMFAVQADGARIITVEGLAQGANCIPFKKAFTKSTGYSVAFALPACR